MLYLWIYCIDIVSTLQTFFIFIGSILFCAFTFGTAHKLINAVNLCNYEEAISKGNKPNYYDKEVYQFQLLFKKFINPIWFIICFTIVIITPSKQSLYLMGGLYLGQQTIEQLNQSEIGQLSQKALTKWLKDYVQEESNTK